MAMDNKSFSANALVGLEYYAKAVDWPKVEDKLIGYLEGVGLDWYAQKMRDSLSSSDSGKIEEIKRKLVLDPKLIASVESALAK